MADSLLTFNPQSSLNYPDNADVTAGRAILGIRNNRPILEYRTNVSENTQMAMFEGVMPSQYHNSGVFIDVHYASESGVAGIVTWQANFQRGTLADIDSLNVANGNNASGTVPATAGLVDVITIPLHPNQMEQVNNSTQRLFFMKLGIDRLNTNVPGNIHLVHINIRNSG